MVEKLLRCYGTELVVHTQDGDVTVRALLQPVTGKLERLAKLHREPLGRENAGQYLYIGPVEPEVAAMDRISAAGKQYHVRAVEYIYGFGGPVYCWAMCVEKGGADQWGMNA